MEEEKNTDKVKKEILYILQSHLWVWHRGYNQLEDGNYYCCGCKMKKTPELRHSLDCPMIKAISLLFTLS